MGDFKSAYKMLRHLKRMGITKEKWEQIAISLQKEGYIDGLVISESGKGGNQHIARNVKQNIKFKDLKHQEGKEFLKKFASILRENKEIEK